MEIEELKLGWGKCSAEKLAFIEIIESLKWEKGLSMKDIAKKAKLSEKTLYNYHTLESSPHNVTTKVIRRVLKAFPEFRDDYNKKKAINSLDCAPHIIDRIHALRTLRLHSDINDRGFESMHNNLMKESIMPLILIPVFEKLCEQWDATSEEKNIWMQFLYGMPKKIITEFHTETVS